MRLPSLILLLAMSALTAGEPTDPLVAGPKIVAEAFGQLSAALGAAVADGGPAKALPVCRERAPAITAQVAEAHGVKLGRASAKPRNPKNSATEDERTVLAEFAAVLAKGKTPRPVVRTAPDGSRTFFAPIVLANPLCLQCHGKPGADISEATQAAIRAGYPEDRATGYKLGELRGLWRVTFAGTQSPQSR